MVLRPGDLKETDFSLKSETHGHPISWVLTPEVSHSDANVVKGVGLNS